MVVAVAPPVCRKLTTNVGATMAAPTIRPDHSNRTTADTASITVSERGSKPARPLPAGPLLPELAQLPWLQVLIITLDAPIRGGIPTEWGLPGAFPRLEW